MTQPARGYQPYQPMAPMMGAPTPPKRSRGGLTTVLAGVLALVVAGLAVGGSFLSITDYRNSYEIDEDPSVYATSTTWWGFLDAGSSSPIEEETILTGLTLVLAGTLLLLGAVFAFVAARTRTSGPVAGGRSLISAGVGVLAGVTLLQLLAVLKQMETYNEQELDAGESLEFTAGLGLWLPLGGVVLGIVAVVLAHVGQRPAPARIEPNTPRMGFPAPYGYRPQAAPFHISDEDAAADTQVVSGATVSEQLTSPSVGSGAPQGGATPAAPVVPPAAPRTEQGDSPAAVPQADAAPAEPTASPAAAPHAEPATPQSGPTPAEAPQADATPAEPTASPAAAPQAESPASPATPATTAVPQTESSPAAPATQTAAPQADATPAEPTAPPAAAPQAESPASPATPATPAVPQTESSPAAPATQAAAPQAEPAGLKHTPAAAPQDDATPAEPAAPPAAAPQAQSAASPAEPAIPAAAPQADAPSAASPAAPQPEPATPRSEPTAAAAPQAETPAATATHAAVPAVAPQADEPSGAPAAPRATHAPAAAPQADPAKPTPLSGLPAAPPAPELSSPDDKAT